MSLATLNKQRSVEKQSIRTTVTISKVSKIPISSPAAAEGTPAMSQSKKIAMEGASDPSSAAELSRDEGDESADVGKRKELLKEKFFNDSNGNERRGEFFDTL